MLDLIVDTSRAGARMGIFGENISEEIVDNNARGESLLVVLDSLLKKASVSLDAIKRVLVLRGPGSFTGLRTGIAFCEGLCFTGKRKLYGVSTLAALTLYGNVESTLVILRARTGYWYFRNSPQGESFAEVEECFWNTERVLESLKNTTAKFAVVDSAVLKEEVFQEILNEKGIEIVQESEGSLSLFREAFNWSEPSPIQDANYIQPSYAEQ
jgi:tRNA threonylcarbamoyladenosine biosynthesis protein TsaB